MNLNKNVSRLCHMSAIFSSFLNSLEHIPGITSLQSHMAQFAVVKNMDVFSSVHTTGFFHSDGNDWFCPENKSQDWLRNREEDQLGLCWESCLPGGPLDNTNPKNLTNSKGLTNHATTFWLSLSTHAFVKKKNFFLMSTMCPAVF